MGFQLVPKYSAARVALAEAREEILPAIETMDLADAARLDHG